MLHILKLIKNTTRDNIQYYLLTQALVIIVFSIIYYITNRIHNEEERLFESYFDCIYFTIVTHFTVGYGDISPKTKLHRTITMIQIITAFLISDN
jgi:voltage-gated potassium channel